MSTINESIIILGCHRSGTSALSAVLHSCGYELPGGAVDTGSHENPEGYYENRAVVHANNRILDALGHRWDDHTPIESLIHIDDERYFMGGIRRIIQRYFETTGYVLKDPRMSTLWPLWVNALMSNCTAPIKLIIAMRNPKKVSESLIRRHHREPRGCKISELQRGYKFWEVQTMAALKAALYFDFMVVDTDAFISNPCDSMLKIKDSLKLGLSCEDIDSGVHKFETTIRRKELYSIADESDFKQKSIGISAFDLYYAALRVKNHEDLLNLIKVFSSHN